MGKPKNSKKFKQPQVDNSRKAQRKQKRLQKKVHRQEHYMKKKTIQEQPAYTPGKFAKRPADNEVEHDGEVKKKKLTHEKTSYKKSNSKIQPSAQDILSKDREKDLREANKLKSEMDKRRRDMFVKANEDEDKIIKKLEKQLGLNKSKNKNNFFSNDGLDYLLEICDRSTTEQIVAAEKHLAEVEGDSDYEQDLAAVTGKEITKKDKRNSKDVASDESELDDDIDNEDELGDDDDDDLSEGISDDEEFNESGDFSDEAENEISDSENDQDGASDDSQEPEEEPSKSHNAKKRKGTKQGNLIDKSKLKDTKQENVEKESKAKVTKSKERIIKAEELSKIFSDDEVSHLSGDDDDLEGFSGDEVGDEADGDSIKKKEEKPDVWEDIYGRKRDKEGNIIKEEKGVYIPPHLRNKDSASDKQLAQLKRQIKSVLNKLAGTNLHWACTSIESLYSNNSRNSVNTTLTQLWLDATVGPSVTPDRLVAEHAALVSVLHANVGSEIGAHFLQELVKRFDEMMESPQPVKDKQLDNLVACLAQMFNFKIYDAPLLYDILNRLLVTLSEKNIDCVLVALRCCGATLRKQAPRQLQLLVHEMQPRAAGLSEAAQSGSRIKFLLEVLMAIKNNNLMKIPNYDPTYQEHLKKLCKAVVRKGNYITPLNIRLEDLLKADERGKWWVVGSAWEGSAVRQDDQPAKTDGSSVVTRDQKLLELARKQRMNTDVRRSIFCVIMAAEDYMDAFEKLQHLGLKGQQEREVVHVLLACCLQEKTYNPYYGVLAQKLCDTDRKYQLSIQFAIWDKIKDIENQSKLSLANLAKFLVHLLMEKGLALSVLKVIQFSDLNKHSVRFMRQILLTIIMNEDLQASLEVFHRISKAPKLHLFRESLKLFIQHFLVKNAGKGSSVLSTDDMVTLKDRAAEVHKILTMYDSKLKF